MSVKVKYFVSILLIYSILSSCGKIIFRKITCRDFQISGENYWFPLNQGDSVVFVNSQSKVRKKFNVVDKQISHITNYTSDTGCGCSDISRMLLTSGSDSLWFYNELKYVEKNKGDYREDIVLIMNGKGTGIYETSKTKLDSYAINNVNFADVEYFECKTCKDNLSVKKVYRAKNIGILSFEFVDGQLWVNENLSKTGTTTKESFQYKEETCQ
jgi:hypothetical protein